jgi:hypothetical protein
MWNKIKILIFIVCLALSISAEESEESDNPAIIWKAVPDVTEYQLQIKTSEEEVIINEKVKVTKYPISLQPGKYKHRIGLYNKFGKVYGFTDWIPFSISRSLVPEVTSEKINYGFKTDATLILKIKGLYFLRKTKVTLKNSLNEFPIISINRPSSNTIELVLNNEAAALGEYDLILENPNKKILTLEKFYTLNLTNQVVDNSDTPKDTKKKETNDLSYPYWKSGAMSMLLPGWGQFNKDEKFKAIFWESLLLAGAVYGKSSLDKFNSDKRNYNNSVNQYILFSEIFHYEQIIPLSYAINEKYFIRAEHSSNQVYQASIFVGVIYLANILDALFWRIPPKTAQAPENGLHFYATIQNRSFNLNNPQNSHIEFGLQFRF